MRLIIFSLLFAQTISYKQVSTLFVSVCTTHHKWDINIFVKVKVAQLCPTLCNPMNYTLHGFLQARILEWVTVPFSRGSSQSRDRTQVSCIASGFFTS